MKMIEFMLKSFFGALYFYVPASIIQWSFIPGQWAILLRVVWVIFAFVWGCCWMDMEEKVDVSHIKPVGDDCYYDRGGILWGE